MKLFSVETDVNKNSVEKEKKYIYTDKTNDRM